MIPSTVIHSIPVSKSLYLNVHDIRIQDQARYDYDNHSPKKNLIQDSSRISLCGRQERYGMKIKKEVEGPEDFYTTPEALDIYKIRR